MRRRRLAAGAGVLGALVLLAVVAWYFVLRSEGPLSSLIANDVPAAVSLSHALDSLPGPSGAASTSNDDFAGRWQIVQGESTFVGYRVVETLARFGADTAVGRTHDLGGALKFNGNRLTNLDVTADLSTLKSNQPARDDQLTIQGLETDVYPIANFVLTVAVLVPELPLEGQPFLQTVTGNLSLHGVTRQVDIDVEAALYDGLLIVVGSTEIAFADFNIDEPQSFYVLSMEDHGTMEFQLVFAKRE